MSKRKNSEGQKLLFFPDAPLAQKPDVETGSTMLARPQSALQPFRPLPSSLNCELVISGTYRKDFETLKRTYEEFRDLGCDVLSPSSVTIVSEDDGFVYMKGEEQETPTRIEERHLSAIQKSNFVWLHAPNGYVGPTSALEIGFAHAAGVPVFAMELPNEPVFRSFVQLVGSPSDILSTHLHNAPPPAPALKAFQEYYRRAAIQRGYSKEGPKECLLLMVEEVGELARAVRKREKLVRHASYEAVSESHELADVFLYVVHMANVLGIDLADVVRDKETLNITKFLATMG
ncbi:MULTISPECIES: MazG nucleotide pyrophosphohydrolase domain-containing protein [Acidobacterium]|uniref:MazG domain protein n=1 Tax=Acidobacterium capsulatum (strain ATCC 51196 / DSM 11244 / BCRC 80197 / JCM 7670 / NBRC 15755 / NCIMB 13165 / 161) TaxID=240015 RepID=C1F1P5_ACIC5|nr:MULTISPECIES: MazG nucleotide pyrophosphohydrolase domain-containing protein [Acidobacterium]ACO33776.1 MazG domain protein [Acidobacterium capsulatum ATCC 51196]